MKTRVEKAAYAKQRYQALKSQGKCGLCGRQPAVGRVLCDTCGTRNRKFNRFRFYGMAEREFYDRLHSQAFSCSICQVVITEKTANIDHDHTNGRVRGLLCGLCNTGIGHLQDNMLTLESAIRYLREAV